MTSHHLLLLYVCRVRCFLCGAMQTNPTGTGRLSLTTDLLSPSHLPLPPSECFIFDMKESLEGMWTRMRSRLWCRRTSHAECLTGLIKMLGILGSACRFVNSVATGTMQSQPFPLHPTTDGCMPQIVRSLYSCLFLLCAPHLQHNCRRMMRCCRGDPTRLILSPATWPCTGLMIFLEFLAR